MISRKSWTLPEFRNLKARFRKRNSGEFRYATQENSALADWDLLLCSFVSYSCHLEGLFHLSGSQFTGCGTQ